MKILGIFHLVFACVLIALPLRAAGADVSGTWKWEMGGRNGEARTITAKLKQDGNRVTGTIAGPQGREIEIAEGKVSEAGQLTFKTTIERGDRSFTTTYQGKVEGDKLTGTTEFTNRQGESRSREWKAQREGASVTGKWKTTRTRDDGSTMEFIYDFKQEGEKLTGTTAWNNGEAVAIRDGKVQGDKVFFKVVRERDGRSFSADYTGKVTGDAITGTVDASWGEGSRSFDWEAKRVK